MIVRKRIHVLLFALFVGGTLISCSGASSIKLPVFSRASHSIESGSPVATLDGTTVKIMPYGASFEIPVEWFSEVEKERNPVGYRENLYISWEALDQLYKINGDNAPDAEIMDSVLPFELCAVHVGSKGWGNYLSTDLYARLYVVDGGADDFEKALETLGLERARGVYNKADLKPTQNQKWKGRVMSILELGEHTLLFKDLDFYYQSFGDKTVVFVFIHQSGWDGTISQILTSFKWTGEKTTK